jgi:radical SAM superfamily enzyme YgiQ (UPF0313 family)
MKVLLTAPPFEDLDSTVNKGHLRASPNLGLYLLAAILDEAGHQVKLVDPIDFDAAFNPETRAATLAGVSALLLSANSCTWPRTRSLLLDLEAAGLRPLSILGGPHGSTLDEHVLRSSPVDYIVRGEGERALPELLAALAAGRDPAGVPGLSFLRDGQPVSNPQGPLLTPEELAALPLPRFDLMPAGYYDLLPVETSRGCHHACIFCSVSFRRNWRGLAPADVISRLERLVPFLERTRERAFFLIDDCFSADHQRLAGLADGLAGFPHPLCFEARIGDVIAPGVIESLVRLPIEVMEMGVECGYEPGLSRVGKKLTLPEVERAAGILLGHDFRARARFSFVMGLPGESRREIEKTLAYAFKLAGRLGSRLIVSWLTVFPGSIVWKKKAEWGIEIEPADYDLERWWRREDVFRRCHPALDPERDLEAVLYYVQLLIKLFPNIRHDGFFRELARRENRP